MSANRAIVCAHEFCALPIVRRLSHGIVVGLAVFLLTLVVLRERFHGYLAEVRLSGPPIEGLNLDAAAAWIKQSNSQVAAVGTPAGEISPKSQLRVTLVSPRPGMATVQLDQLAERWLYQYLPQRLQTYRRDVLHDLQAALVKARDREDAAHQRLESLRQHQLAQMLQSAEDRQVAVEPAPVATTQSVNAGESAGKTRDKLATLQLELAQLQAHFTDEHPQIVALRSQISSLQRQLNEPQPAGGMSPSLNRADNSTSPTRLNKGQFVSTTVALAGGAAANSQEDAELSKSLAAEVQEFAVASRERQAAEHRLSDRMQVLADQPGSAQWTAHPAAIVTRLGGTPRSSTLVLGFLLAAISGTIIFRAAPGGSSRPIETAGQLASALALPIVGNLTAIAETGGRMRLRVLTPARVWLVVKAAEAIVAVAICACFVAITFEPSLARQVVVDPFGTLSEVIGRFIH